MNYIFSKRFFIDALVSSFIYGLIVLLSYLFFDRGPFTVLGIIGQSIPFGILLSITLNAVNNQYLKGITDGEPTEQEKKLIQTRTIVLSQNPKEVHSQLLSLSFIRRLKFINNGQVMNGITNWSSFSFGEKIEVEYKQVANQEYEYCITSKPRFILVRYDYGINLANINAIYKLLRTAEGN